MQTAVHSSIIWISSVAVFVVQSNVTKQNYFHNKVKSIMNSEMHIIIEFKTFYRSTSYRILEIKFFKN